MEDGEEEGDLYTALFDVITGRLTLILSVTGVALNAMVISRMKNRKTVNTPTLILQMQLALLDLAYCFVPSLFLAYIRYDRNNLPNMLHHEREILLLLSGYVWFLKQFGTYFLMTVFGMEKVLIAYVGSRIQYTKRSAYISTSVMWAIVFTIVTVPIVAGCTYAKSAKHGLLEFSGTWSLLNVPVSYFEWTYTILPILFYILAWTTAIKILISFTRDLTHQKESERSEPLVSVPLTTQTRQQENHNPKAFLYISCFILFFTPWVAMVGGRMVDMFEWKHALLARHAPDALIFTSGILLMTLNAIVNPMIYCI